MGKTPSVKELIALLFVLLLVACLAATVPAATALADGCFLDPDPGHLNGVWAADANHIWAVGEGGRIVARFPRGAHNATYWDRQPSPTGRTLNDVSGVDARHIWAVGEGGTVLFYDGTRWAVRQCAAARGENITAVSALDATHVWAVTFERSILFYDGAAWRRQQNGLVIFAGYEISAYRSNGRPRAWAATNVLFKFAFFDGRSWQDRWADGHTLWVSGISALDDAHVWVAGLDDVWFFNGDSWRELQTGLGDINYQEIHAVDAAHVYAVGGNGNIVQCVGGNWARIPTRADPDLNSVFVLNNANHDGYAVGEHAIFHFNDMGCRREWLPCAWIMDGR